MTLHILILEEEETVVCDKAVKDTSAGRITLYRDGLRLGVYSGISDFSKYVLEGGSWSDPDPTPTEQQLRADVDFCLMLLDEDEE